MPRAYFGAVKSNDMWEAYIELDGVGGGYRPIGIFETKEEALVFAKTSSYPQSEIYQIEAKRLPINR